MSLEKIIIGASFLFFILSVYINDTFPDSEKYLLFGIIMLFFVITMKLTEIMFQKDEDEEESKYW